MIKDTDKLLSEGNDKMKSLYALSQHSMTNKRKVCTLGVSGMEASIFTIPFIRHLLAINLDLIVLLGDKSISEESIYEEFPKEKSNSELIVITNKDEWDFWKKNMVVLHIYLRNRSNVFLLAPMCAGVFARIANGLCDDLLVWKLIK